LDTTATGWPVVGSFTLRIFCKLELITGEIESIFASMLWYQYLSYFFGGFALVNAIPHYARGLSGRTFPSPFASPPGKGQSSAVVNALWGFFNIALGYVLLVQVGNFDIRSVDSILPTAAGALASSLLLAKNFGDHYAKGKKK
jgi:hypothetical protein